MRVLRLLVGIEPRVQVNRVLGTIDNDSECGLAIAWCSGRDDEDMTPIDTTIFAMLAVPSTRAHTLHLTYQVSSFLGVHLYYMNYMMLPNDEKCIFVQHHITFGPRQARVRARPVLESNSASRDSTDFKRA